MLAIAASALLAAQPAPPGWTQRTVGSSVAYEKDQSVVVMLEPRRLDARKAMEASKRAAAGVPGCGGLADAPIEGDADGYMALAGAEVFCALFGVPLPDGRFQGGVIVVPRFGGGEAGSDPAFTEAGQVFAQVVEARKGWLSGPEAATVRPRADAPRGGVPAATRGASDPAGLEAALDAVPTANIPLYTVMHGRGSNVGWPPSYVYYAFPVFLFEGGRGHDCQSADPQRLDWAAIRADEDCEVYEWRKAGEGVEFREVGDEDWESQTPQADRTFAEGERVDVRFENKSGVGIDYGAGSMAVSSLSGKNLVMTRDGRITVTGYSSTLAAGPYAVASASGSTPPIQGRYRVEGPLIAIQPDAGGGPILSYVGVDRNEGSEAIGHVFFGGTHYWNPDD